MSAIKSWMVNDWFERQWLCYGPDKVESRRWSDHDNGTWFWIPAELCVCSMNAITSNLVKMTAHRQCDYNKSTQQCQVHVSDNVVEVVQWIRVYNSGTWSGANTCFLFISKLAARTRGREDQRTGKWKLFRVNNIGAFSPISADKFRSCIKSWSSLTCHFSYSSRQHEIMHDDMQTWRQSASPSFQPNVFGDEL